MAIQYSGNTAIYSVTTGSTQPSVDFESFLITNLQAAGWTLAQVAASDVLTFSSQPAANSTFTLDNSPNNQTYTFVSSGPTGNQILIDTTLALTIQNAVNALTGGAGSGTKYGSSIVLPPNMTASGTATTLTVTYKTAGSAGNGAAASTTGTINATWASSTLSGGQNQFTTAITPQGLAATLVEFTNSGSFYLPGTAITLYAQDRTGSRKPSSSTGYMVNGSGTVISSNTTYKMIASKYQFVVFVPGSTAAGTVGNGMGMGVPFITSQLQAPTISAATNASPIQCTIASHGFTTGDQVIIVGGTGNTAINGIFNITVVDANNFTLNGSTGNGTYNANTAYCSDITIGNTVNEAIWSSQAFNNSHATFRNQAYYTNGAWWIVNGAGVTNASGSDTASVQIVTPGTVFASGLNADLQWYDNSFLLNEPFLCWGTTSGATAKIIGQVWDAAMVRTALSLDQTAVFDSPSHTFWTFGEGNHNSIMFATTA